MTRRQFADDSGDSSHVKWEIVKDFPTLTKALQEIQLLRQREEDILAGIQLVVKGSNAGRDKEIAVLRSALALAVGELSTYGEYQNLSPDQLMHNFIEEARNDGKDL